MKESGSRRGEQALAHMYVYPVYFKGVDLVDRLEPGHVHFGTRAFADLV